MYPNPQHFIIRPGDGDGKDTLVPLIATDQLPDWIRLTGAPRELDAEHAAGLTNLGVLVKSDESCYEASLWHDVIQSILQGAKKDNEEQEDGSMKSQPVSQPEKAPRAQAKAKKEMVPESTRQASTTTIVQPKNQASGKPQQSRRLASSLGPTPHLRSVAKKEACIPWSREQSPRRSLYASQQGGGEAIPTTTNYCRHWCHHGTCKWGLECRYTHRMPTTLEELRQVGLRTVPVWYNLLVMSGLLGGDSSVNTGNKDRLDAVLAHLEGGLLAHGEEDKKVAHHHSADVSLVHHRSLNAVRATRPSYHHPRVPVIHEGMRESQRNRRHQGRANLHTNASLAANAADLSAASKRQTAE